MLAMVLPAEVAHAATAEEVLASVGLNTGCGGIQYPLGGWLCPAQLTTGAFELARQQGLQTHWGKKLTALTRDVAGWQLSFTDGQTASSPAVVLATGHNINQLVQTEALPVYAVGGQVSHIPTSEHLTNLLQVLCYDGYLTPKNPNNQQHCIGASYHRGQRDMVFNEEDQRHNRQRLIDCFPQQDWVQEVDVSANEARCGVRCATRDHLPMVGNVPDYAATLTEYATLNEDPQAAASAPYYQDLFMLGGLGSRGLCTAPLTAEVLAAQMSDEPLPLDAQTLAALNPNRLWVRKLLKGKAVK